MSATWERSQFQKGDIRNNYTRMHTCDLFLVPKDNMSQSKVEHLKYIKEVTYFWSPNVYN